MIALALALSGCGFMRIAREPMEHRAFAPLGPAEARGAVVLLPGFGDDPDTFVDQGFVDALRRSAPGYDIFVTDAHFGYYRGDFTVVERLHADVTKLLGSVEGARESMTTAKDLTAQVDADISGVNDIVQRNFEHMTGVADMLGEQSNATKELAEGLHSVANGSKKAAERANQVIATVRDSEALIEKRFEMLDSRTIHDYVLYRAKSDHFLWKKRLSEMLVGFNNLTESELADHHSCRLGKWYNNVSDETIRRHPAFAALEKPHAAVHEHGKRAAALFARGDREGAYRAVEEMNGASVDVVRLLDELIAR